MIEAARPAPAPLTPIIICADDYGLSPGVNAAIETLIAAGRLSATSVMTTLPDWHSAGPGLKRLVAVCPADVGLHFTLTEQPPLTACAGLVDGGLVDGSRLPSVNRLLARALARRLPLTAIAQELRAQLDAFEQVWGAPPDYIDGHQHVHMFPGIRTVVVDEIIRRYRPDQRPYLRSVTEPVGRLRRYGGATGKAMVLATLGGALDHRADRLGLERNDSFRGIYDFFTAQSYGALFRRFLAMPTACPLVHCHPGHVDGILTSRDGLTWPREREFAYLASTECGDDLLRAGVRVARFAQTRQSPLAKSV